MNRISFYLSQLSNSRINKVLLINDALSNLTYDELQVFRKRVPSLFRSLLKNSYLRRKRFSDIFGSGVFLLNEFVDVYGALTFVVLNNSKEINRYLELKNKLDFFTAIQEYKEAYALLDSIESEVSVSMMSTYYRLKLTRLDKGINESALLHNEICKENDLLSHISNITFRSSAVDVPFEGEIEGIYRSLNGEEIIKDFYTAIAFPFKRIEGDGWLGLLLNSSLIDLYEGLILQFSKVEVERLKGEKLTGLIGDLAKGINDERLQRLLALLNPQSARFNMTSRVEERELIENYYSGNYEFVYVNGSEYLKKHPFQSTIVDLFYKSCVYLNKEPRDLFPEGSLAERIHGFYLMSLLNKDLSEISRSQLRNICMAWYVIPGLRHIYQLVSDSERQNSGGVYINFWRYSLLPEIRDYSFFNSEERTIDYLVSSGYDSQHCSMIAILKGKEKDVYNQSIVLLKGLTDKDIPSLIKVIDEGSVVPALIGTIVSQLFDRLIDLSRYSEAILLFVHTRISHPFITLFIDKQKITRVLNDAEDKKIPEQMELAAFYTMINAEIYKRYLAYKRYLKSVGIKRASEISDVSSALTRFFIGRVVDRGVLTLHITEFDTEEDIVAERIELCKKMLSITNEKAFADEITTMIKEQEVKAFSQQVNDSKIHVDVQSLINSEFEQERLLFETFSEVDDNLETYEQKDVESVLALFRSQEKGKSINEKDDLPAVKLKKIMFQQMVLSIRDKFLYDPKYGLDKYLSARIRHGTLITQLRNHFLYYALVTNKKEGGEYLRTSIWTQHRYASLSSAVEEKINNRLLIFTEWFDNRLNEIKEERIQIKTERNNGKIEGMFDYSESLIVTLIDELGDNEYESFEAFVHSAIGLLWKWTGKVLQDVRQFFQRFQEEVLEEMANLKNDIIPLMTGSIKLSKNFKDAITSCRTDFQSDILVVSSWFKPEQSNVRFFTIQQAVDTSLAVINKISQSALSFKTVDINDTDNYNGEYFNSFHDIFHDMLNNILGYEARRPSLKGKGEIHINNIDDQLFIEVSNPIDKRDVEELNKIVREQKKIPSWIAGGKTRREGNSGCMKIYSTVMYSLGAGNLYENSIQHNRFLAKIRIDTKQLKYYEDTIS